MLTTSSLLFAAMLVPFAKGGNTSNETVDPTRTHCDLVSVSYVSVHENGNGTVNIDFSWDRKSDSYGAIGGPIRMYVIRHGPMQGGRLVNTSEIIEIPFPEKDEFSLENIQPYDSYGVQICAVTTSYKILFQNDLWDKSWTGSMDLSTYRLPGEPAPSIASPKTTPSTGTKSYRPECDLVQTSYVDIDEDSTESNNTLTVRFAWDKKQTSYQAVGPVEGYTIRYGPLLSWGADIQENNARYLRVGNESESFVLHDIPRGGYYGLQVCAVSKNTVGTYIDWQKDAWLGGIDFTSYNTRAGEDESTDIEKTTSENSTFTARCDLVQSSHVAVDDNSDSLTVHFSWDEKPFSYASIAGSVSAYRVRYGPQKEWGSGIEETEANYFDLDNETESFTLRNVPRGGYYGVQICAIVAGEESDNQVADWRNQAWLGSMNFTSYSPMERVVKPEKTPGEEEVGAKQMDQHKGTVMSRTALGIDYTIMLAILTALTVIFIVLACFWLAVNRKRQNAKIAAMNSIEPAVYP